jgi:hypothetical protein
MGFIQKDHYKHAHNVMGSVKARYQSYRWAPGPGPFIEIYETQVESECLL